MSFWISIEEIRSFKPTRSEICKLPQVYEFVFRPLNVVVFVGASLFAQTNCNGHIYIQGG